MLFRAYNLTIESDVDLKLPIATSAAIDIKVVAGKVGLKANATTKIHRAGIVARMAFDDNKILLDWAGVARFEAIDGETLVYEKFIDNDDVFRLFILSEALGLLLFQRNYFVLHGSAVQVDNEGVVFIGSPGNGKSTTVAAFAKNGFSVFSDDLTAIIFDDKNKPMIIPAFPQIKIWEDAVENLGFNKTTLQPAYEGHNKYEYNQSEATFPTQPVPLKQIYVLQQPFSRKTGSVKANEVPIELLKHFPLPHRLLQGTNLQRHFMDCVKIASAAPVVNLRRPKSFVALGKFVESFGKKMRGDCRTSTATSKIVFCQLPVKNVSLNSINKLP